MRTRETLNLGYYEKVKETEKAVQLKVAVSWAGNCHVRDLWFPKSVIVKENENNWMEIKSWFLDKLSADNHFHNYRMNFEMID